MKTISTGEFKGNLSSVLKSIMEGEEYAISYGKKKEKVAVILPYSKYVKENPRKLGLLSTKGKFKIADGFKMSEEELLGQ
ncbi:MAG: type II toxin-antitoxin system Phd/YefM family antitoxin [Proteobacteria bacterium]|nr:type II toxin-antitoxin system Phd/YefM family antitoxin [Pseudomonadota bacterium]